MINKTEIWKDITGYEGYYQVSNKGRVKSLDRYIIYTSKHNRQIRQRINGRILYQGICKGYKAVKLSKNHIQTNYSVHRLVSEAFIANPENKPEVNHKNGNKKDNRVVNLEWVTASENQQHSYKFLGRCGGMLGKHQTIAAKEKLSRYRKENAEQLNAFSRKKVRCIELNKVFTGICKAARETGVANHIAACCNGTRKTCGGYHWEYVND